MLSSSVPGQAALPAVVSVQRRYPLPGDYPRTLAAVDGGIVAVLSTADGIGVVRVDLATGRVTAPTDLRGFLGPVVVAGGLVWVPGPPGVWGLDPRTLAHRVTVGVGTPVEDLAAAGGLLWAVGWASLTGIDPATGRVVRFTPLSLSPGTETMRWVRVAASPNGTALWTAEVPGSGDGPVQVQLRDPHTGAITGEVNTHLTVGLLSSLAATNDRAWASYSTPYGTSASELQVNAVGDRLTVAPSQTSVQFSNALTVSVAAGVLWITDPGGTQLTCADLATGRIRLSEATNLSSMNVTQVGSSQVAFGAVNQIILATPTPACRG